MQGKVAATMRNDVCWKVPDERSRTGAVWYLKTARNARSMGQGAMATYHRPDGVPYAWQYRLTRRPKGARVLP